MLLEFLSMMCPPYRSTQEDFDSLKEEKEKLEAWPWIGRNSWMAAWHDLLNSAETRNSRRRPSSRSRRSAWLSSKGSRPLRGTMVPSATLGDGAPSSGAYAGDVPEAQR